MPIAVALAVVRIVSDAPGASVVARHRSTRDPATGSRQLPRVAVTDSIRSRAPRITSFTFAGLSTELPLLRTTIVVVTRCPMTPLPGVTDLLILASPSGSISACPRAPSPLRSC